MFVLQDILAEFDPEQDGNHYRIAFGEWEGIPAVARRWKNYPFRRGGAEGWLVDPDEIALMTLGDLVALSINAGSGGPKINLPAVQKALGVLLAEREKRAA